MSRASRVPFMLLIALLLAPLAGAEDAPAYAPALVVAERAGTSVVAVEWAPGERTAETYRVYGLDGESATLLHETATPAELAASVPAGFSGYGVAGVVGGMESPLVLASVGAGQMTLSCILIQTDPPSINMDGSCGRLGWLELRRIPW